MKLVGDKGENGSILLDYSKNVITEKTLKLLFNLVIILNDHVCVYVHNVLHTSLHRVYQSILLQYTNQYLYMYMCICINLKPCLDSITPIYYIIAVAGFALRFI